MGEIVNLRRVRKVRERRAGEERAQENRVRHGLTKAERKLAETTRARADKNLDGHRRDSDKES